MTDPFGDLEVNDNVVEIKTPAKKEKEAVGDNTGLTGTVKGGGGYECPWLVLRAADAYDMRDMTTGEDADVLVEVMENLWKASRKFQELGGPTQSSAPKSYGPPAGAAQSPDGETHQCKHGQMQYRSGIAKASGKPYRVFACPHPVKAEECDPIWPK